MMRRFDEKSQLYIIQMNLFSMRSLIAKPFFRNFSLLYILERNLLKR